MKEQDSAPHLFAAGIGVSRSSPWFVSLARQVREMLRDRKDRRTKTESEGAASSQLFAMATRVSQSAPWFFSLRRQLSELREERKHPGPKPEITAKRDLSALERLIEQPSTFSSLFWQIRGVIGDTLHPRKLQTTVAGEEVQEIWSKPNTAFPKLLSAGIHVLVITLALLPWASSVVKPTQPAGTAVMVYAPPRTSLVLNLPERVGRSGGGGGGGKRQNTPASLGRLPRPADKQFVPPDPEPPKNLDPLLVMEPTVVAPQLAWLPQINLLPIGDPNGVPGPPSSGPGTGGGIGTGRGRGVGEGSGPGVGPGEGGGFGGGVYRVGGGVTSPVVIYRVEPQYSEEARKARYQGTVVLQAIVRRDGTVDILRVVRSLGFGLDENAIVALKQWRFRPGLRNGEAVDVSLNVEVNYNLR